MMRKRLVPPFVLGIAFVAACSGGGQDAGGGTSSGSPDGGGTRGWPDGGGTSSRSPDGGGTSSGSPDGGGSTGNAGADGGGVYFTDTELQPPALEDPTTYTSKAALAAACEVFRPTGFGITGPGTIYNCVGTSTTDLLIDLSGTDASNTLTYPLWISNWRNVIVRGVEWDMAVQPGNGVNELPGKTCDAAGNCIEGPNRNPRPRVPYGGGVIRTSNFGQTWIEGVHIDLNGHNGDCVIWRSAYDDWSSVTPAEWQANFFTLQNSRCEGREGQGGAYSLHADLFQTQGGGTDYDIPYMMRFENVTDLSGQEGVVTYPLGGWMTDEFYLRNYNYKRVDTWDLPNDDNSGGAPFASGAGYAYPEAFAIENFWYDNGGPYSVGIYREPDTSLGAGDCASTKGIIVDANMHCGSPPNDFAPADKVGRFYVSPHP